MGELKEHTPVMLIMAIFSRYDEALHWAKEQIFSRWGEIALQSELLPFEYTTFYEPTMGSKLQLQLVALENLVDPVSIVEIKLETNILEETYAGEANHPEQRPLNLDPGYLTPGKFVLATTKDASHRLYLDKGIYAEATLHFCHGQWQHHNWTYPSYQQEEYKRFLFECRTLMRQKA